MDFLRSALVYLLTEKCYDRYFIEFNFFDAECFKTTLSKCLGLSIIAGSLLVKVPQIIKILRNKSGEGISVVSVTLDLCAITIAVAYGFVNRFPFSSYGDGAFLAVQTAAIAFLILFYENRITRGIAYVGCYLGFCFVLMSGLTPLNVLWFFQGLNIPLLLTGKLSQAFVNWRNGSTGQLSAVTAFMLFFGSTARIFTSIQETGDAMLVVTYIASTFANTVIVVQMLYYWNSTKGQECGAEDTANICAAEGKEDKKKR